MTPPIPHAKRAAAVVLALLVLAAPASARRISGQPSGEGGTIYNVVRRDGIPAILNPRFVSADKARVPPNEKIIGVVIDGQARAYSTWLLNHHEIVNDQIGKKKFAVVW